MFGYQILYFFFFFFDILLALQLKETEYKELEIFVIIGLLGKGIYPLMNSLMYGLTVTAKKYCFNIFVRNTNFDDHERLLHELRRLGEIRTRAYVDLIEISDEILLEANS